MRYVWFRYLFRPVCFIQTLTLTLTTLFERTQLDMVAVTHTGTNATMYTVVPRQLYLDNPQVFDVLENIVIMNVIPISTFVVVVVATTATVVQLKRIIVWRQRASTSADGTEVGYYIIAFCNCLRIVQGFIMYYCIV